MAKRNYKEDLDFILRLKDSCGREFSSFPDYDFTAKFYTSHMLNAYVASSIGGVQTNCYNDNGKIHIVMDNHRLGLGVLNVEFTAQMPDAKYPDGYRKVVIRSALDVELVDGAVSDTDQGSVDAELTMNLAVVTAYEVAQKAGYTGSQEDYYAGLSTLPQLATLVSDLSTGKAEVAQALNEQGLEVAPTDSMSVMADKVRELYHEPQYHTSARPHAFRKPTGTLGDYDIVDIVNANRRADYPFVCGCTLIAYTPITVTGADAILLSDGRFITGRETHEIEFTDGTSAHWMVFYFESDFFSFPIITGCTLGDIAALDCHPSFSESGLLPFSRLFVDAETAEDYTGRDFRFGDKAGSVISNAMRVLPSGVEMFKGSRVSAISLGGLEECYSTIAYDCANLTMLDVSELKTLNKTLSTRCTNLQAINVQSLEVANAPVTENNKLTSIHFPNLRTIKMPDYAVLIGSISSLTDVSFPNLESITGYRNFIIGGCPNVTSLSLPKFKRAENEAWLCSGLSLKTLYLPALEVGCDAILRDAPSEGTDVYLPSIVSMNRYADLVAWGASGAWRIHFGSQQATEILFNHVTVKEVTIKSGFTGTLIFDKAVDLTPDCLRNLLNNLGDNTGKATKRIQMGATNIAKLTDADIAVATAKNYTVS